MTYPKNQRHIRLGEKRHRSLTEHKEVTEPNARHTHPATKNVLALWITACRGNDGLVMCIEGTKSGKNSGRIFRLSAPGAPTTDPDHTKEQQGISGYSFCLKRVPGAHQPMSNESRNPMRDIPQLHQNPQPQKLHPLNEIPLVRRLHQLPHPILLPQPWRIIFIQDQLIINAFFARL